MSASPNNLVWLDLEMTGLDVDEHRILQAAVVITNPELELLAEACFDVWQPETALSVMSPFVRDMHEKTGLLERVRQSRIDVADAEQKLLSLITAWCSYPATLCGNTIWQDRKFVDRYMPGLGRYAGYRMVDVSSIKVLAARWYGDSAVFVKPKAGAHDALVDIKNSVDELAYYRRTLFAAHRRG